MKVKESIYRIHYKDYPYEVLVNEILTEDNTKQIVLKLDEEIVAIVPLNVLILRK